ncbi:MAG: hypothetical protein LBE12_12680 [Planctomycetaceae bacterium]|jgi:hypothetical protein|nr:hypothetical protein [Planctomycetaceae bacterium]
MKNITAIFFVLLFSLTVLAENPSDLIDEQLLIISENEKLNVFYESHKKRIDSTIKSGDTNSLLKELQLFEKELLKQFPNHYIDCMYGALTSSLYRFQSTQSDIFFNQTIQKYFQKILDFETIRIEHFFTKLNIFFAFQLTVPNDILDNEKMFSQVRKERVSRILALYQNVVFPIDFSWDITAKMLAIEPLYLIDKNSINGSEIWKKKRDEIFTKDQDQILRKKFVEDQLKDKKLLQICIISYYLQKPENYHELIELLNEYKIDMSMKTSILELYKNFKDNPAFTKKTRDFLIYSRFCNPPIFHGD